MMNWLKLFMIWGNKIARRGKTIIRQIKQIKGVNNDKK